MTLSAFEDGLIHFVLTNKLAEARQAMDEFLESKGASLGHSELLRRELSVLEGRVVELQGSLEELDHLALIQAASNVKAVNSNGLLKPYEAATQTRTNTKVLRRKVVASLVKNQRADESDRSLAQRIHDYWAKSPDFLSVSKTPAVSTIQNDITAIKRIER
mgnify:CR=1 FL=1|jgi:hypothetical protein